jgi:mRNA interferase MazF
MVVQNDTGNWHAPTLIVAAITSEIKKLRQPTHIVIGARFGLPYESMLLLEQLFTIDKTMLLTYVGTADDEFLELVDKAVAVSVGVHPTICNTRYKPDSKQGRTTRRRSNNGVQKSKIY